MTENTYRISEVQPSRWEFIREEDISIWVKISGTVLISQATWSQCKDWVTDSEQIRNQNPFFYGLWTKHSNKTSVSSTVVTYKAGPLVVFACLFIYLFIYLSYHLHVRKAVGTLLQSNCYSWISPSAAHICVEEIVKYI